MKHAHSLPRALAALLLAAVATASVFAQGAAVKGAAALLPPEASSLLAADGKAVRAGAGAPDFLPLHPASAALRDALATEKPSVLVEAVFELKRALPSGAAARSAALSKELASIYGILRSLGSLQGIEYYSASRKTMRTFYAESYIVDGPDAGAARLPDPSFPAAGSLPGQETLYAVQRDLSFGTNTYRYDFSAFADGASIKSVNLTRMSYGIVPVLAAGALATRLLVLQAEDSILFYAVSGARAPGIFKGRLEDSFSNRAEALFRWFSGKFAALKP